MSNKVKCTSECPIQQGECPVDNAQNNHVNNRSYYGS